MTLKSLALPAAAALAVTALFAPPASAKSNHKAMRHSKTMHTHRMTSRRGHGTMKGRTITVGSGTTGVPTPVPPPNGAGGAAAGGTL